MTEKPVINVPASVRQRLLNLAKAQHDDFQRIVTQYALERLLYRLSKSRHSERFTLKGALLFLLWMQEPHRRTKDLDLLGTGDTSPPKMAELFREICGLPVPDDGLTFDLETINAQLIREDNIYGGVRVRITAFLDKARIAIQIDVGFGDAVTPAPQQIVFPTLLDFPAPVLRAYVQETVIAEKLSALVELDIDNSRMKDFYDLWVLGHQFTYDQDTLCTAIAATFARRSLTIPQTTPVGLTQVFADDKQKQSQWKAFVRQSGSEEAQSLTLSEVVMFLGEFLLPVLKEARLGCGGKGTWSQGGPWQR